VSTKSIIFFAATLFTASLLSAQTIKSAYVFGESGDEDNAKCGFDYNSGIAAVESALRYNRVNINSKAYTDGISIYINITNLEINNNTCGANISLNFFSSKVMNIPQTNKFIASDIIFCSKGALAYFPKTNMQSKINSALKDYVDQCLSEIDKKAR
jgi:hypothetical protein